MVRRVSACTGSARAVLASSAQSGAACDLAKST